MKKDEFRNIVKSIILEVKKEKKSEVDDTKPEKNSDYLDQETPKYRRDLDNDPNKTSTKLLASIRPIVNKLGKNIQVVMNDNRDIMVKQPGIFSILIKPKWAGMFDVEAFRNMTDRVYAVGLSYEQVINFIKVNFASENKSYVQKAYDKAKDQTEDSTKKKAKELPKTEPVKYMKVADKDIEDAVTDKNDQPDSQMSTVKEKDMERQEDHSVEKNKEMPKVQKMIKKEVDDDLTKNWKK
jgi:predicted dienelactone hydrolase